MMFDNYDLKEYIVKAIKDLKFESFTPVQKEVFNVIDAKKNIFLYQKENDVLVPAKHSGKVIGEFVCDAIITDKSYGHDAIINAAACMSDADAASYCLNKEMYGWHISNLVIYDKPKELSEFNHCGVNYHFNPPITRPPQSWCYVEEQRKDYKK